MKKDNVKWCVYVLGALAHGLTRDQIISLAKILQIEKTVNQELLAKYGLHISASILRDIIRPKDLT